MVIYAHRVSPSFEGAVYIDNAHTANIEIDGSGHYQGLRKLWRCRLVSGEIDAQRDFVMRINDWVRPVRFWLGDCGRQGFVELL